MGSHNETSSKGSYDSTLEEMAKFDFDDEESIVRTILIENTEDTTLAPTTANETLHNTDIITTNISFDDMDDEIDTNIICKDTQLNDTGPNEDSKENCQVTNRTCLNTKEAQSPNNISCVSKTLEHSETEISRRNNKDANIKDSEPIKQKTNFPRTKFTSLRAVKKFPGKMSSMKKMQRVSEQNPSETVEQSLENNDHIDRLATDSARKMSEIEQRIMAASEIVTEYLIYITPYVHRYVKTNKSDSKQYALARNVFKEVSSHFFSVSYTKLASTIFPYSNNPNFTENLCNLSLKLAQKKGILNTFKRQVLYALCSEIIEGTKAKMSQSTNDGMRPSNTVNHNQHLLTETLGHSFNRLNMHYTPQTGTAAKTTGDITLVFPAENIDSAIKISYNPALTSQQSIPSQSSTNVSSNITAQNNINTSRYPAQPLAQLPSYDQWSQQQHQTAAVFNQHQQTPVVFNQNQQTPAVYNQYQEHMISNNQQGLQQRLQPSAMPANVIRQNPHSTIRINSCYQVLPSPDTRTFPGSNIPSRSEQYHSSPGQYQQTDMTAQRALSFGQQFNQMDQSDTQQRHFIRLNNYPQERSTSRDSGFFSPVQDTYQQDCMIASPTGMTPSSPASCNPYQQPQMDQSGLKALPRRSASFGCCVVCKNLTNLMCLGCSKAYYCGQTCQNIDWAYHSKDCKSNT